MSLEDIQQLLLSRKISPNKLLGQNFMVEPAFYPQLAQYAALSPSDVVLDAGAGFGFLTRFLSDKCRAVVAVEKDRDVAAVLREQVKGLGNVTVVEGDVLKVRLPPFNKVIAIPPYYLSSQLVLWVLEQRVDCAVMILQREFCARLVAKVGSEEYGWLTVVTQHQAEAKLLDPVPKDMFYPPPEVDSVILSLKPWATKPFEVKDEATFIQLTKWLFTQRNKKLAKALAPYIRSHFKLSKQDAEALASTLPFHDKRARELVPQDFGAIANALPN
ncbi:MAG: 16S rRNA (adenine(1518)-N(6)/adenine(1519)-N(6))-dimethyltransferase RsmA [Candidatus Bathyarchaeota archaeon]|nr:16S rRNA (adenine(1518)-N(6)/adenine(1519)-N(6))-dimethyltransferase RsmA [Candidatus Bathyarchaeota archaeon]